MAGPFVWCSCANIVGMYGEPSPDKIPTGFLTTFRASKKRVGKEKSQSSSM